MAKKSKRDPNKEEEELANAFAEEELANAFARGFKKAINLTFTDQMLDEVLEDIMERNVPDIEQGYRGAVPTSVVRTVERYTSVFLTRPILAQVRKAISPSIHAYYADLNDRLDVLKFACNDGRSIHCPGTEVKQPLKNFYIKRRSKTGVVLIERTCKACCSVIAKEKYARNKRR